LMYDWWSAAVAACHGGVGYLNEILVYQRVHGNNISMGKGFSHLDKEYKNLFLQMVARHIEAFSLIAEPGNRYKDFFMSLSKKWQRSASQKFNLDLFLFLLKYRSIVFWYKKRKFALFSHIKHSFKLSGN